MCPSVGFYKIQLNTNRKFNISQVNNYFFQNHKICKQLLKQVNTLDHCSSDIQYHVEDKCFVLTFLKATMRIMLVTNTAIPPTRENKANTISALRTEKKKKSSKVKQELFAKSWYMTKFVSSQHILFLLSIFHHMNVISFQDTHTASTVSLILA